jgi:protein gp37
LSLRRGWSKEPWKEENEIANVVLHPDRMREYSRIPLKDPFAPPSKRQRIFNSMGDPFHRMVPDEFLRQWFR